MRSKPASMLLLLLMVLLPACGQEAALTAKGVKKVVKVQKEKPGVSSWLEYRGDPLNRAHSFSPRPDYSGIKWRYSTADRSTSSPAVIGGKVIVATETGRVHAIDAETGRRVWAASCGTNENGKGFVISSPKIFDGRIYVGNMNHHLYCLSLEDGEKLWSFETKNQIYSSPKGDARGIVFGCRDGWIYCLDPKTGDLKWERRALRDVGASAAIMGRTVYLPSKDKRLYRFDIENGKDLGHLKMPGGSHCCPALGAGFAFMVFTGRKCGAMDLFRGELAWHDVATSDIKTSCAYDGRRAIIPLGRFVWGMNAATGEKLWEIDATARVGSPVLNSGEVVFLTDDGVLRVHSLENGQEQTRMVLGEKVFASPTIVGGDVFVSGLEGHVFAIE